MPERPNQLAASSSRETGTTVTLLGDEPPSKEKCKIEKMKDSRRRLNS
jgi:hypothetical protein